MVLLKAKSEVYVANFKWFCYYFLTDPLSSLPVEALDLGKQWELLVVFEEGLLLDEEYAGEEKQGGG